MADIQVVNVFRGQNPPYVDIVAGGFAFTFWYENEKLRYQKRMESGAQNNFSFSVPKEILSAVRKRATAILKKH